jgi:hypothetical protein
MDSLDSQNRNLIVFQPPFSRPAWHGWRYSQPTQTGLLHSRDPPRDPKKEVYSLSQPKEGWIEGADTSAVPVDLNVSVVVPVPI